VTERELVEDDTDRLSEHLLRPLTRTTTEALLTALLPAARSVLDSGILPFPNPIGLPRTAG
jgi:hypothetical protein